MDTQLGRASTRVLGRTWLKQGQAFARRHLLESTRSKVAVFWSFAFPVIWYLLTVHLNAVPGGIPVDAGIAKAVYGVSFGIFGAFTVTVVGFTGSLTADLHAKRYRKYRSLPVAPSADLVGRFVAGAILGVTSWGLTIGVAGLDGAVFRLATRTSGAIILLAVVAFCIIGMLSGLAMALVIPQPDQATAAGTGIVVIGFFLTGYNGIVPGIFPLSGWLLNVLPNSLATRMVIHHMVTADWGRINMRPPAIPNEPTFLVLLVVYATVLLFVGVAAMHTVVYGTDLGE